MSGEGTNLQALIDACADPAYGAQVVAVGADRDGIAGLQTQVVLDTALAEPGSPMLASNLLRGG